MPESRLSPSNTSSLNNNPQLKAIGELFSTLTLLVSLCCFLYMVALFFIDSQLTRMVAPAIICVSGMACRYLRHYATPNIAFITYFWSVWAAIMFQAGLHGGAINPALHLGFVLILMGGWLLGLRYALWTLLASVITLGLITWAIEVHWLSPAPSLRGFGYWFTISAVWTIGYVILRLVLGSYHQNMLKVQALNNALEEKVQALASRQSDLELAERKVRQLLQASPLPITVANFTTGVYVDVNPAWQRFFGISTEEALGKTSVMLGFWSNMDQRQGWIDLFDAHGRVSEYEVTFNMRNGPPKIFALSSEKFMYGNEECVLTMSVDITQRKALENNLETRVEERTKELAVLNTELQATVENLRDTQEHLVQAEKLSALGRLVAGVSHELNTPIGNAIMTMSTLAEDTQQLTEDIATGQLKKSMLDAYLERLHDGFLLTNRSLDRAANLITSFKQVAVDQVSERRRIFDLADAVLEVVDTMRPTIKRSKIELDISISAHISLDSYPGPLGQVIINLVSNAIVHAFQPGQGGQIFISEASSSDRSVVLHIRDDGCGIPLELQNKIFDPFFTTKLGKGGSGLGLAISHRIVTTILGGTLSVISDNGHGTTFVLTIPRQAPVLE